MDPFNLIDSPWIPVRYLDGTFRRVSLATLFCEAAQIADLNAVPHERISLMRLLVCITQAELGAPESPDQWNDFGHDLETRVPAYLHRPDIHPHFNLLGEGPRFLQVEVPRNSDPVGSSKLIPHLATGNNSTLLDHEASLPNRALLLEDLAAALLAFQCFYPLYGAGYKGRGPCVDGNMIHTLVMGDDLRAAILSNCLTQDYIREYFPKVGMGRPLWELNPTAGDFIEKATGSYLGRLVPRHRSLWLLDNGTGFHLAQEGMEYPRYEQAREASATVVVTKKNDVEERRLLPARLEKSIWRDLHMMTVIRQSTNDEARAPLVLHCQVQRLGSEIAIWSGALVTDLKAKILDTVESSFSVPYGMFSEHGRILYANGVQHAEVQSNHLYGAVRQYGAAMKNENPPTELAKQHYWNTLEARSGILLDLVRHLDREPVTENFGEGNDPWTQAVRAAAHDAYEKVCPRQTPRQIQAYAAGIKFLRPKSKNKVQGKRQTTTETAAL
jgi:CRISPR system Cascade subunit CasA